MPPAIKTGNQNKCISLVTNVVKDLLDSGKNFHAIPAVVWEYVANGLQYRDRKINPDIRVQIDEKNGHLSIQDNGYGMDRSGLQNFFVMHGENRDRLSGSKGWLRGRHGTGKSAGFGVGNLLRITTVRQSRRWIIQINRKHLEMLLKKSAATGVIPKEVPLAILEDGVRTQQPNGTLIEVENVRIKPSDVEAVRSFITKHLRFYHKRYQVKVNGVPAVYQEPAARDAYVFSPSKLEARKIGNLRLVIKVANAALDESARGIAIVSAGILHEVTLAGHEGEPMSHFIFGEVNAPLLDKDRTVPAAFDTSRHLCLNVNNSFVRVLHGFIGRCVAEVRAKLELQEAERKKNEEQRILEKHATEITQLINLHYRKCATDPNYTWIRPLISSQTNLASQLGPRSVSQATSKDRQPSTNHITSVTGTEKPENIILMEDPRGSRIAKRGGICPRAPLGFHVNFQKMGKGALRSTYETKSRTILINEDHRQIRYIIKEFGAGSPEVKRLALEVAMFEFSAAFLLEQTPGSLEDAIQALRQQFSDLASKGISLYAATV